MKQTTAFFALAAMLASAAPAMAASDYLLQIDDVKGESAATPVAVDSWSFGVCNSGQCTSSTASRDTSTGQSSGRTGGSGTASWDLATNKGGRMASGGGGGSGGQVSVATGDVDGDGSPDLIFSASQSTVYGFSLTLDAASPGVAAACATGKIASATLTNGTESFAVSSVSVVCTKGGAGGGAAAASYARSGITRIDSTPARISTNMTVGKQTQGATFGEKVQPALASSGPVTMTFTGGQMKHTKSGHVTLLK
ncbi:hypothetical protein [Novosphingobium sp.]|uniref:hypothetical protein n=1 Tax=Novosphingobium sp. TaxID=1874826 RepID=UPI00286D544C|nr:hypothetical protein [Novosphingobium sp.]